MARKCIFRMAIRPSMKSSSFSGSGWWTMPLYPSPVVRGLFVYMRGTMRIFSFTFSCIAARRVMYSHTESSWSAEHGPMIRRICSESPVIISLILASRSFFCSFCSADSGYKSCRTSGEIISFL